MLHFCVFCFFLIFYFLWLKSLEMILCNLKAVRTTLLLFITNFHWLVGKVITATEVIFLFLGKKYLSTADKTDHQEKMGQRGLFCKQRLFKRYIFNRSFWRFRRYSLLPYFLQKLTKGKNETPSGFASGSMSFWHRSPPRSMSLFCLEF